MEAVVLLLLGMCSMTLQQPTLFRSTYKGLNGVAILPRSAAQAAGDIRAVYYYDQTVAVVELGVRNSELHNCNLVEVYEPNEAMEVLKNLSTQVRPMQVTFQEMTTLMRQCDLLDKLHRENSAVLPTRTPHRSTRQGINPLSLLSGILPGTKWCGTGDIAENYHDLGQEAQIDRCCRSHDLCPVKVRAQRTRYNLTNYSLYTKSHCSCDEALYHCLKTANHGTANVMGHIYFNLVKVECIEDVPTNQESLNSPARRFIPVKMNY